MSGMSAPGWADLPPPTWHQQRVPGPHGFAVREQHLSSARLRSLTGPWRPALRSLARPTLPRPPHLVPNVRDDRDTPLVRAETGESVEMICPTPKAKYFCKGGLDR